MKLGEIIRKLEEKFPLFLQEKWDNSGLLIGDSDSDIKKIQISLDITENVIDKAIENRVDLIICHHPVIFKEIKQINNSTILGRKIIKLIKNGINVYALHTNFDSAKEGLNEYVCKKLGGKNSKIIQENFYKVYKLSVFIPEKNFDIILNLVKNAEELEFLGYKRVSYTGQFIERILENEKIEEKECLKIEFLGEKNKLWSLFNKIKEKHPYKEPAYEMISLDNNYRAGTGIGRIFSLETSLSLEEYGNIVKSKLGLDSVKIVKSNDKLIKKVAMVNGSGMDFWKKAYDCKADVFLTGDITYHDALDAYEKGLNLIDIGHYESEHFFNEIIIKNLSDNLNVEVYNEKRILETL